MLYPPLHVWPQFQCCEVIAPHFIFNPRYGLLTSPGTCETREPPIIIPNQSRFLLRVPLRFAIDIHTHHRRIFHRFDALHFLIRRTDEQTDGLSVTVVGSRPNELSANSSKGIFDRVHNNCDFRGMQCFPSIETRLPFNYQCQFVR